jgi:hypothetical protein
MINPLIKKCPVSFSGASGPEVDSLYLVTFVYWIQVTAIYPCHKGTLMKYSDNLIGGLPKKMCKKLFVTNQAIIA